MESHQKIKVSNKKVTVNATLSPYIVKKMNKLIEDGGFSSVSDLISIAVTEFLVMTDNIEINEVLANE